MFPKIFFYVIMFLCGIIVGSFLNVCIQRILKKENVSAGPACVSREVRSKLQYILVEVVNGVLYLLAFWRYGLSMDSLLYCLLFSALLVLSVIDFQTYRIPPGINIFILVLGLVRVVTDLPNWRFYGIGLFSVSLPLIMIYLATGGRDIGGGDVKLMAVIGLITGWKRNLLSFLLGCILGLVIHVCRMKLAKEGRVLAMGPYLSMGIVISVIWGEQMIARYF